LQNIPYELHPNANKFLQRKEIKLAFNYLLLLGRPKDNLALEQVIETLEGFGEKA
jgi:superfamily I DNA/RNA helicase